jgi:hypothetical protein
MSRFTIGEMVRVAALAGSCYGRRAGVIVSMVPSRSGHASMDQYTISDVNGELMRFADFQLEKSNATDRVGITDACRRTDIATEL